MIFNMWKEEHFKYMRRGGEWGMIVHNFLPVHGRHVSLWLFMQNKLCASSASMYMFSLFVICFSEDLLDSSSFRMKFCVLFIIIYRWNHWKIWGWMWLKERWQLRILLWKQNFSSCVSEFLCFVPKYIMYVLTMHNCLEQWRKLKVICLFF